MKPLNRPTLGRLQPIETPATPNDLWAMDTVIIGNDARLTAAKYVQLVVDHQSILWALPTRANNAGV